MGEAFDPGEASAEDIEAARLVNPMLFSQYRVDRDYGVYDGGPRLRFRYGILVKNAAQAMRIHQRDLISLMNVLCLEKTWSIDDVFPRADSHSYEMEDDTESENSDEERRGDRRRKKANTARAAGRPTFGINDSYFLSMQQRAVLNVFVEKDAAVSDDGANSDDGVPKPPRAPAVRYRRKKRTGNAVRVIEPASYISLIQRMSRVEAAERVGGSGGFGATAIGPDPYSTGLLLLKVLYNEAARLGESGVSPAQVAAMKSLEWYMRNVSRRDRATRGALAEQIAQQAYFISCQQTALNAVQQSIGTLLKDKYTQNGSHLRLERITRHNGYLVVQRVKYYGVNGRAWHGDRDGDPRSAEEVAADDAAGLAVSPEGAALHDTFIVDAIQKDKEETAREKAQRKAEAVRIAAAIAPRRTLPVRIPIVPWQTSAQALIIREQLLVQAAAGNANPRVSLARAQQARGGRNSLVSGVAPAAAEGAVRRRVSSKASTTPRISQRELKVWRDRRTLKRRGRRKEARREKKKQLQTLQSSMGVFKVPQLPLSRTSTSKARG